MTIGIASHFKQPNSKESPANMAPPSAIDVQSVTDTQIVTISTPLSVNGVPTRRAKAPRIPPGIAAHASSDMFKSPVSYNLYFVRKMELVLTSSQGYGKPKSKRWDRKLILALADDVLPNTLN